MPIKVYKPTTAARRNSSVNAFTEMTKIEAGKEPDRTPQEDRRPQSHRLDHLPAHRRRAQAVLPQDRLQAHARTASRRRSNAIEYDPNRSVFIALLNYEDGEKRYILAPQAAQGRRL